MKKVSALMNDIRKKTISVEPPEINTLELKQKRGSIPHKAGKQKKKSNHLFDDIILPHYETNTN
jgi:hypothetical protein